MMMIHILLQGLLTVVSFIGHIYVSLLISYTVWKDKASYLEVTHKMQLRREKIAERMKNLQELVPNSNKVGSCFLSHHVSAAVY